MSEFVLNLLRFVSILFLLWLVALPIYGFACPVCYAKVDSPMVAGLNLAIITLMLVTGSVLGLFVSFFLFLRKRGRRA